MLTIKSKNITVLIHNFSFNEYGDVQQKGIMSEYLCTENYKKRLVYSINLDVLSSISKLGYNIIEMNALNVENIKDDGGLYFEIEGEGNSILNEILYDIKYINIKTMKYGWSVFSKNKLIYTNTSDPKKIEELLSIAAFVEYSIFSFGSGKVGSIYKLITPKELEKQLSTLNVLVKGNSYEKDGLKFIYDEKLELKDGYMEHSHIYEKGKEGTESHYKGIIKSIRSVKNKEYNYFEFIE